MCVCVGGVIEKDIGHEPPPSTWPRMGVNVILGEKAVLRENLPVRVLRKSVVCERELNVMCQGQAAWCLPEP